MSGLVINKNYEANFERLQKELGWVLRKEEDVTFEMASSNWKDEETCDVYFSEKGTLLFISIDRSIEFSDLNKANTLTFSLSETSLEFNMTYSERGVEERSIMEVEYDRVVDEGERLDVEDISEDAAEIIWNQMEVVLGESFFDIDPKEEAVRYRFVKASEIPEAIIPQEAVSDNILPTTDVEEVVTKKRWKFWQK